MRVRGRSALVAWALGAALLVGACGVDDDSSAATTTTAGPALADAVAATRDAPVYAFTARSLGTDEESTPVVIAGRSTGDGAAYQVFTGASGASAALAGAGTRLEIDAAGRCRVVDLAAVEPAEGGTPVGTADPEAVLQLLEAARDVDHDVARGRDRWTGAVPAAAIAEAATADDPTRVARMTGALGADAEVAFTAAGEPGAGLSTVRLDLPDRQVRLVLDAVDGSPAEVSSPVGCFPGDDDYASIEAALAGLQLDCTQSQADMVELLGDLPPEVASFAREQAGSFGPCSAVFDP